MKKEKRNIHGICTCVDFLHSIPQKSFLFSRKKKYLSYNFVYTYTFHSNDLLHTFSFSVSHSLADLDKNRAERTYI